MGEKSITPIQVMHVISEPGDATRYDYLVFMDGPDDFTFAPCRSTFAFPQRLDYWEVQDLTDEKICEIAKRWGCNPWTVKECARTVLEIRGGD